MSKGKKIALGIGAGVVAVLLLAVGGFLFWVQANTYSAQPAQAIVPTGAPRRAWRVFEPSTPTTTGFIFYPGGLVDADAYAWLGPRFAERGIFTVIVPMPLNLAVLNPSEAMEVLKAYPNITRWAIGGHSLGGAMAGQFLMTYPAEAKRVNGLILWGARLSGSMDVSTLPVTAASVYGTLDGIAPPDLTDAQRLVGLPASARLFPIEGGNHSMFGDYGLQTGDNPMTLPLADARNQIVDNSMTVFE